jgi:FlaA1/EpsC-like NDP-sugar epimerase
VGTFCGVENYDTVEIGTRPGEKIHETLHTSEEGTLIRSNDEDLQFEKGELLEFITNVMKGEL